MFTTFSGPIRAGTERYGSDRNTGLVILAQSFDSGDLTGSVVGNTDTVAFKLPQGAQIYDIVVDQVVAAGTGTLTAGRFILTIAYIQRSPDGLQNPTATQN